MPFQSFTGKEYLQIDIASNFGKDKLDWNERLDWFNSEESNLHSLVPKAEEPALFYAGILAWEKARKNQPCGYPISLDATCSGIQILAALAGDRKAAEICNVVDTGHRQDAYVAIYQAMLSTLGTAARLDRKQTKNAIMTHFFGSTATPKRVFGTGTRLLETFYETIQSMAPGAEEINQMMLHIWNPTVLENSWVLPDNFLVVIKVMGQVSKPVEFLGNTYEVVYEENMPIKGGRSLGANMVHSIDGMIVREMNWRCNHDPVRIKQLGRISSVGGGGHQLRYEPDFLVQKLWKHYQQTGFLSARILNYLNIDNLGLTDPAIIYDLIQLLPKKPFQVISVHDCFRCLPNHGNDLRLQYNNLLAEVAKSNLLGSIVGQIIGRPVQTTKLDPQLWQDIYATNYSLS